MIFCLVQMKHWTKIDKIVQFRSQHWTKSHYFVHSESQTGQKFDILSTSDESLDKV